MVIAPEVYKEMEYNKKFIYDPLPENLKKHVVNFDEFWNVDEACSFYQRAHTVICHTGSGEFLRLTVQFLQNDVPCRGGRCPAAGIIGMGRRAGDQQAQACVLRGGGEGVEQLVGQPARPLGVLHQDQDRAFVTQVQNGGGQPLHLEIRPLRPVQLQPERVERRSVQQATHRFARQFSTAALRGEGDPLGSLRRASAGQRQEASGDRLQVIEAAQGGQGRLRPACDAETGGDGASKQRGGQAFLSGPLRGQRQNGADAFLRAAQGVLDLRQHAALRHVVGRRIGILLHVGLRLRHRLPRGVVFPALSSRFGNP